MRTKVSPTTPGKHHAAMPYLVVKDAAEAIEFYHRAFGAKQVECVTCHGKIGQAEIRIGSSHVKLSDEYPETGLLSPQSVGGSPAKVVLHVPDVDRLLIKAVATGAKLCDPVVRSGNSSCVDSVEDPFGHIWRIEATRKRASTTKSASAPRHGTKASG